MDYSIDNPSIPAIDFNQLSKTYKDGTKALKDLTLQIPQGSMFALLGPNGAGKSTTINILADLVRKTGGTASVLGHSIDKERIKTKKLLGIVPQEIVFDPFFTPYEIMQYQAGYFGVSNPHSQIMEIFERLNLTKQAQTPSRSLSGGMKRRLLVAKALIHKPKVLILDEPTAGVDLELRQQLWAYIQELNQTQGMTVVLTTHYLEEVEMYCQYTAIIHKGSLTAHDSTKALLSSMNARRLVLSDPRFAGDFVCSKILSHFSPKHNKEKAEITFSIPELNSAESIQKILGSLDFSPAGLDVLDPKLEDLFSKMTYFHKDHPE